MKSKVKEFKIEYRLAARTEAAGKYNPNAPQEGNEDNYDVIFNLRDKTVRPDFDVVTNLDANGLVMVVADGMGGHNAGEVASKIAVDTVTQMFYTQCKPTDATSHQRRAAFMEKIICEADSRIRRYAEEHEECQEMGSTIAIAWIVNGELSVSWCGDSRIYLYAPKPHPVITMVSEDHSYVQSLVQRGIIPYEATFGHPQGNVVTRCLGGGGSESKPESRMMQLAEGDIVLMCSDGLSGVLFDDDRSYEGERLSPENLCDIITRHQESMRQCCEELFAAAQRNRWHDNVTAILCQIVNAQGLPGRRPLVATTSRPQKDHRRYKRILPWAVFISLIVGFIIGFCVSAAFFRMPRNNSQLGVKDTIPSAPVVISTQQVTPPEPQIRPENKSTVAPKRAAQTADTMPKKAYSQLDDSNILIQQ